MGIQVQQSQQLEGIFPRSHLLTTVEAVKSSLRNGLLHKSYFLPSQCSCWQLWPSRRHHHDAHPPLGHLILLVFEAVMEVVCVSLPGYIVARQGMFDADQQKFVANLNVALFTPCLIFTKLAKQLTAEKLVELAVIPVIFVVQTLV